MSAKVIQGSFLGGQPKLPPPVPARLPPAPPPIQTKTAARPAIPPAPAFSGRRPGPPAPAFAPQPVAPAHAGRTGAVQRHGAGGAFAVEAGPLGLASGSGKPLPDAVRGQMEAALGADFSNVRVYVGPQAERIGAIAFTVGSDIYFAPGRYQPDTAHGQQLLGHELAHVVQQRAGRVRNPLGTGLAVVQDHALEAEADRLGRQAAGHRVAIQAKMAQLRAPPTIQQARSGWRLLAQYGFTAGPTRTQVTTAAAVGAAPTALNLNDPTQWPALPAYPTEGAQTITAGRKLPQQQQAEPTAKPPQQEPVVKAPVQQDDVPVPNSQPPKPLSPMERKLRNQKTGNQPAQQPVTAKSKKKPKSSPMSLQAPDVGAYLNTLLTPGHATFHDIVIFTLNNNPGYNQIHVHRNNAGVAVQISKKSTDTAGNGPAVPIGSPLFAAAAAVAANY
jgi:Domain of unknown function (DUF4157)